MTWPFTKTPKPTLHDEYHQYTVDLVDLTKLREKVLQRIVLAYNSKDFKAQQAALQELEGYNRMIAVAQATILELTEPKEQGK